MTRLFSKHRNLAFASLFWSICFPFDVYAKPYANVDLLAETAGQNPALDRLLTSVGTWPIFVQRGGEYYYIDLSEIEKRSQSGFYIDLYGMGAGLQGHGIMVLRQIHDDGRRQTHARFGLYTVNSAHGDKAIFPELPGAETTVALDIYNRGLEAFWGPVPESLISHLRSNRAFQREIKISEATFTATLKAINAQGRKPKQLIANYILGDFQTDWRSLFLPVLTAAKSRYFEVLIPSSLREHQDNTGRAHLVIDSERHMIRPGDGFDLAGERRFLFPNGFIVLFNIGKYLDRSSDITVLNTAAAGASDKVNSAAIEGKFNERRYGTIDYAIAPSRISEWVFQANLYHYEGEMKDGTPDGFGVLYLEPARPGEMPWMVQRRYIGGFKDGKPNGYGALFSGKDEMVTEGRFSQGLLDDWIAYYTSRGDLKHEESFINGRWKFVEYVYDYYDVYSRAPRKMRLGLIDGRKQDKGVRRGGTYLGDWQFVPRKVVYPSSECIVENSNSAKGCAKNHLFVKENDAVLVFSNGEILRGPYKGKNGQYDFYGTVTVSFPNGDTVTGIYNPRVGYPMGKASFYRASDGKKFSDASVTLDAGNNKIHIAFSEMVKVVVRKGKKGFLDYLTAPFDWLDELISPVTDPIIQEGNRFIERNEDLKKFLDDVCKGELCKAELTIDWDDHTNHELPEHLRLGEVDKEGYSQTTRRDPAGNVFPAVRMANNGSLTGTIALASPAVTAGTDHASAAYVRAVKGLGSLFNHSFLNVSLVQLKLLNEKINEEEEQLRAQLAPGETRRYLGAVNRHDLQWTGFKPLAEGAKPITLSPTEVPIYREITNLSSPTPFSREEAEAMLKSIMELQERNRCSIPELRCALVVK